MTTAQDKFQGLLRELFQFDCADLDFGIYRIMNHKRDVLEKFIAEALPKTIAEKLRGGALADQAQAAQTLVELDAQIRENLGGDALDGDGNLAAAYHETPLGKRYLNIRAKAAGARNLDALEADVFNHLYAFFRRYYQDGDFISRRRYSKREHYAIPYNGEEVHLHWANHDQYYIKTAEHFQDYAFTSGGVTVHFKLVAANMEQNNVKGDKRLFLPRVKETTWNKAAKQLVIPFEYRPLTEQEAITYTGNDKQDKIIAEAVAALPEQLKGADKALRAVTAERDKNNAGESVSFLEHHLRQYTRRNTSDFFIHKNLKGFLSRELDFYLKNEVLNLDEMEAAGEYRAEGWFQITRAIKSVGIDIIEFLHQIESFQKMLWEKRKFVTETHYCIAVGSIDEHFYRDIAISDAQWKEWEELLHIDEEQDNLFTNGKSKKEKRIAFLKAHPTLMIDTKNLDDNISESIIKSINEIDEKTDALLVHSENFQALAFLLEKYHHDIECIHIDPPYNTATSGFLYKNEYQHSTWLAMMENRIALNTILLNNNGSFLCHIDENEYERLHLLLDNFLVPNAGTLTWDKRNPMNAGQGIATQHEYVAWRSWRTTPLYLRNENVIAMLDVANQIIKKHGGITEVARQEYSSWVETNSCLTGGEKAYRYIDEQGCIYQSVSLRAPEPRTDPKFHKPLIHPHTKKPCPVPPNGFSRTPETLKEMIKNGQIIFGKDESIQPRQKVILKEGTRRQISSVVQDAKKGKADLDRIGLDFPYCHPVSFYLELIAAATDSNRLILDYFAGSGTTGHAVINLNREDGGKRKFILVEMGDYFDTVLLPRMKKVSFTPEWKDGKPKRMATAEEAERGPRIIKYLRLESYEDALNNIAFDDDAGQAALQFDDYLLQYMLKWETRHSETLLNVEKLCKPFDYKLVITKDGVASVKKVDLPETFNYLLGLHVNTRKVYDNDGHRYLVYRGRADNKQVAVIWRDTEGWAKKDFEKDKRFVLKRKLTEGADEVFVNGDSYIPGAKALEPVFKARMFAPVEG